MARGDASNGWSRRAILTGSNSDILDIQFSPNYLGLKLVDLNFYFIINFFLGCVHSAW